MGVLNRGKHRVDTTITIDVRDLGIDFEDPALDEEDCVYVRNCVEDARACLNRPERGAAEAMIHLERALRILETAIPRYRHDS